MMPENDQPVVSVSDLRVVRGDTLVLPELSLDVPRGALLGLLGPSGSGKSTLMRAIVGVQRITGGEVRVLGHPAGEPEVRRRVGYMTQSGAVYGDLSVKENLRYFAALHGAGEARLEQTIRTVGLEAEGERVVGNLSGGQRSRVSLAAALIGNPDLLVLDEPTVGLDPVLRRDLWRTFRELAAAGTTLIVSSHVMGEADECDEVALLREGRLIARDTPDGLRAATGAQDLGEAFLSLIEGEVAA
jgi:ABC-2 type transport system ATP-binding protein